MRTIASRSRSIYINEVKKFLELILEAYSSIFFVNSKVVGVFFFAASLLIPNVGLHGLIAVLWAAFILRRYWYAGRLAWVTRYVLCNSVLFGLGIGSQFLFSIESITLLGLGVIAVLLIYDLLSAFVLAAALPVLSMPFALTSIIFALWTRALAPLVHLEPYRLYLWSDFHFQGVLSSATLLFETLGSLVFVPSSVAGIIMSIGILYYSRITFVLVIWAVGLSVLGSHIFYPSVIWKSVFPEVSFSSILCSVALGGYFLPFSKKSVAIASLGIALSIVLDGALRVVFTPLSVSTLSMPYVLATWMVCAFLRRRNADVFAVIQGRNPEETVYLHLSRTDRFGSLAPVLKLPFKEKAKVWQGFSGVWTHRGPWRNALDFIWEDESGQVYRDQGLNVEDYFSFGVPILSPCEGEVVRIENTLPDRKIGFLDQENNWGNYVLIYVRWGYYILLAHLKQNSIQVQRGSIVHAGQVLAQVGNSGYSPQPHLHLHVQVDAQLGSETIPFRFVSYQASSRVEFFQVPQEGESVRMLRQNKVLQFALGFTLGQELQFVLRVGGRMPTQVLLRVCLDEASGFWFLDDQRGGRVSFWKDSDLFYFYDLRAKPTSPLAIILAGLPRLPLAFGEGVKWEECLPVEISYQGLARAGAGILAVISNRLRNRRVSFYQLDPSGLELRGNILFQNQRVTSFSLIDPLKGIMKIQVGEQVLERIL